MQYDEWCAFVPLVLHNVIICFVQPKNWEKIEDIVTRDQGVISLCSCGIIDCTCILYILQCIM